MTPPIMPTFESFERTVMEDQGFVHGAITEDQKPPPPDDLQSYMHAPMLKWFDSGTECMLAMGPSVIGVDHLRAFTPLQLRVLKSYLDEATLVVESALTHALREQRASDLGL